MKMRIFLTSVFIFLIGLLGILIFAKAQASSVFYVSSTGNDNNPGTLGSPFKTITKARDVVRGISSMSSDITIYLRGGVYELQNTIIFDQNDSGKNGFNIIYKNYPGEVPIISGGKQITGWAKEGDKWKAYVGTSFQTRQLYVNGNRAVRARSATGLAGAQKTATGYTTTDTNIQNWGNIDDIEFASINQWKVLRCGVQSISGTTITMKQPCWSNSQAMPFGMNSPSWIENAYELLDSPGEWYLNRKTGWIYYKPRLVSENGGLEEDMNTSTVIAPVLEALIKGSGTLDNPIHNIQFQGLTFSYATWIGPNTGSGFPEKQTNILYPAEKIPANIVFNRAKAIRFEKNIFTELGAVGLTFENGSQNNIISGNQFFDISSNAIQIGDIDKPNTTDEREITKNNEITNNYIHDIAVEYQGGVGMWFGYVQNTLVAHNEIFSLPYSGISLGFRSILDLTVMKDNKIQNNLIHDVVKVLDDGGGIYTRDAQPGTIISGNVIRGQVNWSGALYLDDSSRYMEVYNNVVYDNKQTALIKDGDHYVHDNWWQDRYTNNICDRRYGSGICDVWFWNTDMQDHVLGVDFGPSRIENNHVITSVSEAPSSIVQNAGLEAAYQDIKTLATPANLQSVCDSGGKKVSVSWNAVNGATSYLPRLDDGTNNSQSDLGGWYKSGSTDLMIETIATQYSQTIDCNKEYKAWVSSKNILGWTPSARIYFTCPCSSPLLAPTNLTATTISSSQIDISWNAASGNANVAGYRIYRNNSQVATSPTTSYSDTGLSASTNYAYAVSTYDTAGNISSQSASVSATTFAPSANVCTSFTYSDWGTCQSSNTQSRTVASATPSGCSGGSPILSQPCTYTPPVCTTFTYSDWSVCQINNTQSRTTVSATPSGCSGGSPILSQSCIYTPPVCTVFNYSEWSVCQPNNTQSRTINSALPSGCSGGSPILSQPCTYTQPVCTTFTYSDWSTCQINNTQSRTVVSATPSGCSGGNPILSQPCIYTPPLCSIFTYSNWGDCQSNNTQTRTIITQTPSGCSGGNPLVSQSCTYVPPTNACTSFTFSSWGACQSNNTQTRTVVTQSPSGCSGGSPILSRSCAYVPPTNACTSFTYSDWGACQSNNTQTRTVVTQSPSGCSGGSPILSQPCTYVPSNLPYQDGAVLKSLDSAKIYLISNGQKRWLTSPEVFLSYGLASGSQKVVTKEELDKYEQGPDVSKSSLPEGTLIRAKGDYKIYIIKPPYKRHIFNPAIFNMYSHFNWESIKEVEPGVADSYITSDLYRADDDWRIFSLQEVDEANGKAIKHHLNLTSQQFVDKGYSWNQVFIVNARERDYYETGSDLTQ